MQAQYSVGPGRPAGFFPVAVFPARRTLLVDGSVAPVVTIGPLSPVQSDFVLLGGFVLILPLLGAMLFRAGLREARLDSGLSRWASSFTLSAVPLGRTGRQRPEALAKAGNAVPSSVPRSIAAAWLDTTRDDVTMR